MTLFHHRVPPRPAALPADVRRGAARAPVLELVTYRLSPGTDRSRYLAAARETEDFLRQTGQVRARYLTEDAEGVWTDVIEWTSLAAAKTAEAEAMTRPEFAAFFEAIAPDSVTLRHATIQWRMA